MAREEHELARLLSRALEYAESSRHVFHAYAYTVWLVAAGLSTLLSQVVPRSVLGLFMAVYWAAAVAVILWSSGKLYSRIKALWRGHRWKFRYVLLWVLAFVAAYIVVVVLLWARLIQEWLAGPLDLVIALALGVTSMTTMDPGIGVRPYSLPGALILWASIPVILASSNPFTGWLNAMAALMASYGLTASLHLYAALTKLPPGRREDERDGS